MKTRLICAVLTWITVAAAQAADPARPNIVFIFSDDYGIPGVGSYGGKYPTPNLDALAAGGTRFQNCFSMPLCGPSRALTLSGRYPFRNGVLSNNSGAAYVPTDSPCIAKVLKQAGYATAVAGKWRQLHHFETPEDAKAWGFDEFMIWGVGAKGERYWEPAYNYNGRPIGDVGGKYGPDLLQEFVIDFIRRHREGPFFVYYPIPLVHGPILRTPDSKSPDQPAEHYADNVGYLDKIVGKLVGELDQLGLRKNTLVVFTGDNGSVGKEGSLTLYGRPITGHKGTMLEGGSRVPLIVNWPGVTPAGKVLPDLIDFSDYYVTFAEIAGAQIPSGVKLDGHSFAPQIRGQTGKPREWVFVQLGTEWYVRDPQWKLTESGTLLDMREAPYLEKPVTAATPESQSARARLQAALDELNPAAGKVPAAKPKEGKKAKKKKEAKKPATN